MKNARKMLCLMLLCVLLVGTLLPMTANAASDELGSVRATGVGYTYNTAKSAYAPAFSSMTASDPQGNVIEGSGMVTSYPFYTDGACTELLRTEPAYMNSYYSYLDVKLGSVGLTDEMDMSKVTITIPGFQVTETSKGETDGGANLRIFYIAQRTADENKLDYISCYDCTVGTVGSTQERMIIYGRTGYSFSEGGVQLRLGGGTLYTDAAHTNVLTQDPQKGVPYYFSVIVANTMPSKVTTDLSAINLQMCSVELPGYLVKPVKVDLTDVSTYGFAYVEFTATRYDMTVEGVEAQGYGYLYDQTEGAYAPDFQSLLVVDENGNKYPGAVTAYPFYSNSARTSDYKVKTEPAVGDVLYSRLRVELGNAMDGYDFESGYTDVNITIPGFDVVVNYVSAREDSSYLDIGYTATRTEETVLGGVEARNGEVTQDSGGNYLVRFESCAPVFLSGGTKVRVGGGQLYSNQECTAVLTEAPADAGTSYFQLLVLPERVYRVTEMDTSRFSAEHSTVTVPGYEVEAVEVSSIAGSSVITFSLKKVGTYVGGVGLCDGDYLASGATATTTTKPADNYAYYEDGVLTLHNYTYSGLGYEVNSNTFAAVYAPEDLTIKLEGENSITKTSGGATNEYAFNMRNDLTLLEGTEGGKLTATSSKVGIFVLKDLTIESGTYHITAEERDPIYVKEGNIQIKDGTFVLNAQRTGLQAYTGGITIENGTFDITAATSMGISSNSNLIIKDGAFTIVSEDNGLWTTGNCTIENGTFNITSGSEGIQVDGESLVIKDGDFTINGQNGIDCANVSSVIEGGNIRITSNSQGILVDGHELIIKGGEVTIDSSSTGIRLGDAADLIIEGGRLQVDAGTGDGIYSLSEYANVSVRGGNVRITGAAYGINCDQLTIEGGDLVVIAENENGHALYTADTIIASTLYAGGTTELGAELEVYDPAKEFDYVHVEVHPTPFVRVPEVWVGGVNLSSGEYLAVGGLAPTTTQPTGGYAHYDSGVLTLHNYTYSGKGYNYKNNPYTEYAFIYTMVDCTIVLEGTNTLTWEGTYLQYDKGRGIVPLGALTVTAASADASLTMVTDEDGILASTAVAITGGNINVDATDSGRGIDIKTGGSLTIQNTNLYVASYTEAILAEDCGIAIENSTLELWPNDDEGIYAADDITITDSHLEIQTTRDCIATAGTVTVNGSSFLNLRSTSTSSDSSYSAFNVDALVVDPALTVQASVDVFSGLGTYVDANRGAYDWVVISETGITSPDIYVGGIGLASGQYLATGATVPTTTQPTGGYAHYASGVLTLHDYTYTGTGFAYDSDLFVAVLYEGDLTVNLEGTNVLDCQTPGGEYDRSSGLYILGNLVLDAAENASLDINTVVSSAYYGGAAILAYGDITVKDGTYNLEKSNEAGADLTIEDGTFHITTSDSGSGLYSGQDITIKGGSFTIDGGYYSISANDQLVIENGIFTLTPDETGLYADNNSVTIKNGVLNINCMDTGIDGNSGVTIQDGSITIQSMNMGIATGSGGSVTIAGGDTRITAVYEGIYAATTTVTGGNMSVKSTDTSNDSAWCAIDSVLTVASDLPIQASTEPTGGLGAYEAAAHDSYDWIVIGTIEDTPMSYAVNLYADPYGTGTVTGAGMYEAGTSVTVTAIPDEHHDFANWTEGGVVVSTNASYTFTIAANRDLTANFQPKSYALNVSASPAVGGTVTGGGTFAYNTYVTVTATANPGYHFVKWTKEGVDFSTNATESFSLEGNCDLVAVFEPDIVSYAVAVSASPAGSGTVTGAGTYIEGSTVTVTATANAGYHFVKWTEDGADVSTDAAYTFYISANRNLVAVFEVNPTTYTVAVSANPAEGGTVTGGGSYEEGNSVTVTATANTGYHFVKWTEGGADVSTDAAYTFTVTANRNLVAVFEADAPAPVPAYAVTVSASPAEGGTVTGGGSFEEGTSITVTAIANTGYHFVKWMEGDIQVSTDAAHTFTVTANRDLVAVFESDTPVPVPTYTVAVSASPAEGGTVVGGGTYNEGELVTVTATANAGFHFVKWTEAGVEVCATEGYAFTVTANRDLVAVFEADDPGVPTYTVTVSASPAEGGTVTGAGTYVESASVYVTATANTGYHFVKWTEGGAEVSTESTYIFSIEADRNLVAVFEADTPAPTDPTDPIPVTYTISVSASPAEGGTVTGGGSYTDGATVTVTATANTGYHFVKWTENGADVSTDAAYTFSVIADVNLVAVFEADAPTPPPVGGTLNGMFRLAGPSRYDTGFAIANKLKEILGVDKFSAVIVAYGQNFPDALTGSYLAAVKGAPILLTEPSADNNLLNYLKTNLVSGGKVYILGGTAAVSQKFEDDARDAGFDVKRLKGAGRYETNLEILKEAGVNTTDEVLIATGKNYADSLSASATGLPMLLVDKNLTDSQKAFLQGTSKKFVILGGTGAVSAEVEAELDAIGDVTRVKGASRYGTSVEIAKRYFNAPSAAVLAYAQGFPDGLCGGPLAYAVGAPLILTSNESSTLADEYVVGITSGAVTGGTARISDDTVREIFDLPANTPIVKP